MENNKEERESLDMHRIVNKQKSVIKVVENWL